MTRRPPFNPQAAVEAARRIARYIPPDPEGPRRLAELEDPRLDVLTAGKRRPAHRLS